MNPIRLDAASLLIIITAAQAVFLIFSFGAIRPLQKTARGLLLLALLFLLWYQLEFLAIRNTWEVNLKLFYGTRYGSWLALGPLLFLYSKSSLSGDFKWRRQYLWHFAPFALFTLVVPAIVDGLVTNRAVHYGMLTVFDSWNQEPITAFQYLYGAISLGQFFVVAAYSARSLRFIANLRQGLKDEYANLEIAPIRWQRVFHICALVAVLLVAVYVIYQFQTSIYRRPADYLFVAPLSLAIYLLSYQALRFPQLFFVPSEEGKDVRYKKSSLSPSAAEEYLRKLKRALEEEELYTNRELRLNDLAQHLDVSPHHLSQVINESLQQNFFDLINQYRVEAAKRRITDQADKSLLQIAFEVGFNNKTSFNNAFKRHVGMTPSQFKKSA